MWTLIRTVDTSTNNPWRPETPDSGGRPSKDWMKEQILSSRSEDGPEGAVVVNGYHAANVNGVHTGGKSGGLERNGMKFRAWGSNSNCSVQDYNNVEENQPGELFKPEYETLTGNKINMYPSLYKLTQSEFRRLTHQVKELPPSGKLRGSGFKKFYTNETGENVPVVYRSQLASSRKAFSDKGWSPYDDKNKDEPPSRCRPVGIRTDQISSAGQSTARSTTPQPPIQPRPKSGVGVPNHVNRRLVSRSPSPPAERRSKSISSATDRSRQAFNSSLDQRPKDINGLRPNSSGGFITELNKSVDDNNMGRSTTPSMRSPRIKSYYDTLTPELAYTLSGVQPMSVYGDRPSSSMGSKEGIWASKDSGQVIGLQNGEVSNIEEQSNLSKDDEDDAMSSTSGVVSDRDSDDDSGEDIEEPKLESIDVNHLPDFQLRPDQLDHIYVPEYTKGDRRKYDFDANNMIVPEYEFASPLSEEMESINFKDLAQKDENWRECVDKIPSDESEGLIIDRLIELERLQMKTVEWEEARKEKMTRLARLREAKSKIGYTVRHQSAKLREKKCCPDCLQLCCIGDCNVPLPKDNSCRICGDNHPAGMSCTENVYSNKRRSDRVSLDEEPPKPQPRVRPKSCHTCQRPNTAKLINANNVLLGRPKSGNVTFSRGQNNVKQPSRNTSMSQITPELERQLWKLGINPHTIIKPDPPPQPEPTERPSTACSTGTRGRAAISPGKSYFSQRRSSLTDIAKSTRRVKSAVARPKQNKNRRPKTAS